MIHARRKRIDWNAVRAKLCAMHSALEQSSTVDDARLREILRQRAERLADGTARTHSTAATTRVLVFKAGEQTYGIELRYVARVFPCTKITPVPSGRKGLLGVANLQGDVRSVLELGPLLGLPDLGDESNRYILLLRHDDRRLGLSVEQIEGIRQVALEELIEQDDAPADQRAGYVKGMTHDKLIVLQTDRMFEC